MEAERRRTDRREQWIGNACEVPCRPVDDKLILVWDSMKDRVTWKVFSLIVSGIGSIGLVALVIMMAMVNHNQNAIDENQKSISSSFSELRTDIRVQTTKMEEVQKDIAEIRKGMRRYNGGRKRWEDTNP